MKAADFSQSVSTFLSDQAPDAPYARWKEETDLFFAFRWAVRWLAAARPDYFIKQFSLALQEGAYQPLPDDCVALSDTVANLRRTSRTSMQLVPPSRDRTRVSRVKNAYHPREYSYDRDRDLNGFFIYPPVPPWSVGYVLDILGLYYPAPQSPDDDVPVNPTMDGVIESLMIYHLCTGENESATLKEVARMRMADVMSALGMTAAEAKDMDAKVERRAARAKA